MTCRQDVTEHLRAIEGAPSVPIQDVPAIWNKEKIRRRERTVDKRIWVNSSEQSGSSCEGRERFLRRPQGYRSRRWDRGHEIGFLMCTCLFPIYRTFDGLPAVTRLIVLEHLRNGEGYFICLFV